MINEVSWFIADKKNIIETNIQYIDKGDKERFEIKKGHKIFQEEQEGCDLMKKYKSVIDEEGEIIKTIVPFDPMQQEDYKGMKDNFKKSPDKKIKIYLQY